MAIYDETNEDPASPYYGQKYYEETATNDGRAGVYHVYASGVKVFVPDAPPPAPIGVASMTVQASDPAPVAAAPAPAAPAPNTGGTPAPAAPAPSSNSVSLNKPVETTGGGLTNNLSSPSSGPGVNLDKPVETTGGGLVNVAGTAPASPPTTSSVNPNMPVETTGGGLVNIPEAGPSSPAPAAGGGATHTVVHGDTLSGIAASTGVSLSQLEALNPQIKDPSLILPGQSINLGSGNNTVTATPIVSGPTGGSAAPASTTAAGAGFPTSSSYQQAGSAVEPAIKMSNFGDKASGWATNNGTGGVPADPANGAVSVNTTHNTNPLHINDKNQKA